MGKEKNWLRGNLVKQIHLTDLEWTCAQEIRRQRIERDKKNPPFKITRKDIVEHLVNQKTYSSEAERKAAKKEAKEKAAHSFLVFKDSSGNIRIGAMARGKAYSAPSNSSDGTRTVREGILGSGSMGMVKILQYPDGGTDAVKIEATSLQYSNDNDEDFIDRVLDRGLAWGAAAVDTVRGKKETVKPDSDEIKAMKAMGYFRAEFIRKRESRTDWIEGRTIKDKKYLIQRRFLGNDLRDEITLKPLSQLQRIQIAKGAAEAVAVLHDQDLIHRDIKPENCMIEVGKVPKVSLVDFGMAVKLDPKKKEIIEERQMGTPDYLAPEIEQGVPGLTRFNPRYVYSKKSDVYALGAMFKDKGDLDLESINPKFKKLIDRMTHPDRSKRPDIKKVLDSLKKMELQESRKASPIMSFSSSLQDFHLRMDPKKQIKMATKLKQILEAHAKEVSEISKKRSPDNQAKADADQEAADKILSLLVNNQERHNETTLSMASNFNLKTLKESLPDKVQQKVCQQLGIKPDDKMFQGKMTLSKRRNLSSKINDYIKAHSKTDDSKPGDLKHSSKRPPPPKRPAPKPPEKPRF